MSPTPSASAGSPTSTCRPSRATVLLAPGQSRTVRLRITARPSATVDRDVTGWLVWRGDRHTVRIPVVRAPDRGRGAPPGRRAAATAAPSSYAAAPATAAPSSCTAPAWCPRRPPGRADAGTVRPAQPQTGTATAAQPVRSRRAPTSPASRRPAAPPGTTSTSTSTAAAALVGPRPAARRRRGDADDPAAGDYTRLRQRARGRGRATRPAAGDLGGARSAAAARST